MSKPAIDSDRLVGRLRMLVRNAQGVLTLLPPTPTTKAATR